MELNLEHPESMLQVRRVEGASIIVGTQTLTHSFLLTPTQIVEGWPPASVDAIDEDSVAQLLELAPEVVLLGSGARQQFAPARVQAGFLKRGIGIECMDNAACARTFNLLAAEGRHVVAAFMLA